MNLNYKQIEIATCHIECGSKVGTGFLIDENRILTANHVIAEHHLTKADISICFKNPAPTKYQGVIIDFDTELDMVIIQLSQTIIGITPLKLLASPIVPQEKWSAFGFSISEQLAGDLEEGVIKRSVRLHQLTKYDAELDTKIAYTPKFKFEGLSGSAVILENGHVFAILLKKLNRCLGAITIQKLQPFLLKNKIPVETDSEKYETKPFSQNWFKKHLEKVIDNAGPRYNVKANVELKIKNVFDALGRTQAFNETLLNGYSEAKKAWAGIPFEESDIVNMVKQDAESLFEAMNFVGYPTIDPIDWKKVQQSAAKCLKSIESYKSSIRNLLNKKKSDSKKADNLYYKIMKFSAAVYEISHLSTSQEVNIGNIASLLVRGSAGQGKTHLFCDVAAQRIEQGLPTLMFFGNQFYLGDPFQQLLIQLDLKEMSKVAFLEKLNELGKARNSRSLIFIDALNEGIGKQLWQDHIATLLHDVKQYAWIGIAVSIRTPFEERIIPKHLITDEKIISMDHEGFRGNEFEAIRIYFQAYKIELHSVPFLNEEFSNPLFLKIFCESLVGRKEYRLPKGWQKFTAVFRNYIETRNDIISDKIDLDPKRRITDKALRTFAKWMLENNTTAIDRDIVHKVCDELVPHRTWEESLLKHLISEGLLLESLRYDAELEPIDTIEFGYERLGDYRKAEYLMQTFNLADANAYSAPNCILNTIFHNRWNHSNIIDALWTLIAEKYKKELFEILPQYYGERVFVRSFLNSLIWRSYESIDIAKCEIYVQYHKLHDIKSYQGADFQNTLLLVAADPYHSLNAAYLHRYLMPLSMPDRDVNWSIWIHNTYKSDSIIDRYIKWAWIRDDKSHLSDESLLLSCTVLTWFLTTSNRFLRDDATKSLICLLKNRTNVLIELIAKFHGVNDIYISERLYAIAYGCILFSNDRVEIQKIAQIVYDNVFKDGNPPVHVLLRDYARNCVERALFLGIPVSVDAAKIRPPYNSEWIEPISMEDAEAYKLKDKPNQHTNWHLYESIMGFGDFARYTIGTNAKVSAWSIVNLKNKASYQQFKKELKGASKKCFQLYESFLKNKHFFEKTKPKKEYEEQFKYIYSTTIRTLENSVKPELIASLNNYQKEIFTKQVVPHIEAMYHPKDMYGKATLDLSILQRLTLKKVYDLGWTSERFGNFDDSLQRGSNAGRAPNKAERIGKKYQWIGYYECLARLADNFEFVGRTLSAAHDQKLYLGPWCDKYERNIDPTMLIRKNENRPSEPFKDIFTDNYEFDGEDTSNKWLENQKNLPDIEQYLKITDNLGREWFCLQCYLDWDEPEPIGVDKYSIPRKQIWYQIRSYLVKKSKKKVFYEWALQQNFMGRWMPESRDNYEYFLRESYWSPAYLHRWNKEDDDWGNPSTNQEQKISVKVLVTMEGHLKETHSYDCSIDKSMTTMLPHKFISEKMNLHFGDLEGYLYDENNELIAFDPSTFEGGKDGLLMNVEKFRKFLTDNDFDIVWTVLGEKRILSSNDHNRLEISGAFCLDDKGEIMGKINPLYVEQSLKQ